MLSSLKKTKTMNLKQLKNQNVQIDQSITKLEFRSNLFNKI